jgi:hypothetical protein
MRVLSILYCLLGLYVLLAPPYSYKLDKFAWYLSTMMRQWIVSLAPLSSPGTSVILVIGPIPEHCTFQYIQWRSLSLLWHHTLTCTFMSLMYISCRMWEDRAKGGWEREKKVVVLRQLCTAFIYSTKRGIMWLRVTWRYSSQCTVWTQVPGWHKLACTLHRTINLLPLFHVCPVLPHPTYFL